MLQWNEAPRSVAAEAGKGRGTGEESVSLQREPVATAPKHILKRLFTPSGRSERVVPLPGCGGDPGHHVAHSG